MERVNPVIDVPAFDLNTRLWHAGITGQFDPFSLCARDAQSGDFLPVQVEGDRLSLIAGGTIPAGGTRPIRLTFAVLAPGTRPAPPSKNDFTDRVVVTDLGRAVLFAKNQRELCRYNYRDPWKPYFYPICGPGGSVVRDRTHDGEGHHFHHGLWAAYGSMDKNSVNLWCEDERILPRRGPAGRITHKSFERFTFGWVYGLIQERLIYRKPDGTPFARETRVLRVYAPTETTQMIDWLMRVEEPQDQGSRGVVFACRVAPSMRMVDATAGWAKPSPVTRPMENPGKIEDGGEEPWVDFSGPVGADWNGIALFDHPANPGYPFKAHAQGYGPMSIWREYPQDDDHRGGAVILRYRAYIHKGDAAEGRVQQAWHDYAHPCLVVLGEVKSGPV
ncbi:MAG: PmoA family protein [Caldilineaceae bacterium]|nr:PmoA family protein [Caldilineaceae bacterium]